MHYYSGMLDSDLKVSKDKKKAVYEPRLQARLAKSIAKWRTWWVLESAINQELWGALEKERGNGTPIILYDFVIRIKF